MPEPISILFFPNGNVVARKLDKEEFCDFNNKGWLQLYFEFMESQGVDVINSKIEIAICDQWKILKPFKTTDGFWNYHINNKDENLQAS